ncbi:MAG TPA: DNA-3-methyladenine glycosylase [Armatimonadota bacterium]|jgi:DNA-3-methyladenine glycosylase
MGASLIWSEAFWHRSTVDIARGLLGALLLRDLPEGRLLARIVETEAYLQHDPACHSVRDLPGVGLVHRKTARNAAMFGLPAHAYIYFTYGNHFMLNVVTQPEGVPEAVLIRAVEPLDGVEVMARLRGYRDARALSNGPGKLTQALGIDGTLNGHDLRLPPLQLVDGEPVPAERIVTTTRIGISKAVDCPWRFYERGNAWVSRK